MSDIFGRSTIDRFHGEHAFLSNFYKRPIVYGGIVWETAEHAYQAMKCLCDDEFVMFQRRDLTAGQAKRLGKRVTLRPDWEEVKLSVMEAVVTAKFSDLEMASMLLSTGDALLIEGNTWNDTFWGTCEGKGKNMLGQILMHVRAKLNQPEVG